MFVGKDDRLDTVAQHARFLVVRDDVVQLACDASARRARRRG
jgi:hypothetical protein